jgi:hypothetical protein
MNDDQQLLTALTTEHFTLQGARAQTTSESSARASLYVVSVSSALIALGFISQVSDVGDLFNTFALTVLPTLYVLGVVTFVRLAESGIEDWRYALAINRIRGYYRELARDRADLFLLSGNDDAAGVNQNMGLPKGGHAPIYVFSSAIAVINGVVGGAAVAVALGALAGASLWIAVLVGGIAAIASIAGWIRYSDVMFKERAAEVRPLFPSPGAGAMDSEDSPDL